MRVPLFPFSPIPYLKVSTSFKGFLSFAARYDFGMAHRDDAGHIILFGKIKNFFDLFFVIPSHDERPQIHRPCGKAEMIRRHARIKRLPVGPLCRRRFSIRFIAGKPFYCAKHDERRRFMDIFRIPGNFFVHSSAIRFFRSLSSTAT